LRLARIFFLFMRWAADFGWSYRSGRRSHGLAAIFCERFAGKENRLLGRLEIGGRRDVLARSFRAAIVEAAVLGTAGFESARLGAAILALAAIVAAGFATRFGRTLRRSVFGGRQIAPAWSSWSAGTAGASSAAASATTTKTAATAAGILTTTVVTAIITAVIATIERLALAIAATTIIRSRLVIGTEILRSGSVGIRLALFRLGRFVADRFLNISGLQFFVLVFVQTSRGGGLIGNFDEGVVVGFGGAGFGQGFAGQQFDDVRCNLYIGNRARRRGRGDRLVGVVMIVVFEILEDVADIQEGVAIEADVDESRLHARKDASDFAFVDAANEGELFFALDVNFY
jgi:hypothetical protein